MKLLRAAAAALLIASVAAPAAAQAPPTPAPGGDAAGAGVKIERMVFGEEIIDGRRQEPDVAVFQGRRQVEAGSLIRVRTDFWPELLESAERL